MTIYIPKKLPRRAPLSHWREESPVTKHRAIVMTRRRPNIADLGWAVYHHCKDSTAFYLRPADYRCQGFHNRILLNEFKTQAMPLFTTFPSEAPRVSPCSSQGHHCAQLPDPRPVPNTITEEDELTVTRLLKRKQSVSHL